MTDIMDLRPRAAKLELHHPITGEGLGVFLNVVGQDSAQMYKTRLGWAKTLQDKEIEGTKLSVEDQDNMAINAIANCITGWDEQHNEFFKRLDDKGTGEYSPELVLKMVSDPELHFIRVEIDKYLGKRENFFA